ncbi:MAG: MFS transporter [Nitriliruptorales bacterium]
MSDARVRLGLRENWPQFALLVAVNFFVGGMVGLERTVLPLVGSEEFGLSSEFLLFSFIMAFGVAKACGNFAAGLLADAHTRKTVLVAGWLFGLPVPFVLAYAPEWWMITAANLLLGINQGLTWSMAVNMKIDLVGPRQRGLAMGLNEASGYTALGVTALLTGYIASSAGLRPEPFWLGAGYALCGLTLSMLLVRDSSAHARLEAQLLRGRDTSRTRPSTRWIMAEVSWRNRTLFGASQAGLVNNLNDGVAWGVLPVLFATAGMDVARIGILKGIYPIIWGLGQTVTGPLCDRVGRKPLIVWGMLLQSAGLASIGLGLSHPFLAGAAGSALLGLGTAMVYPALLATVGDASHPSWRATSVGIYRSWRDFGYLLGGLMAGLVAGALSLVWAVHAAAGLTFLAGIVAHTSLQETLEGHIPE